MGTITDRRDAADQPPMERGEPRSVAVIGAGITGLVTAWELQRRGVPVTLYESAPVAGGAIRTSQTEGWLAEHGPNSLLTSAPVEELIRRLDLESEVVVANPSANKRFIVRDGRLVPIPLSPPAFLSTPLLSLRAKLRVLLEPLVRRGETATDESIASFVRRRLGREVLDYAVNPFIAGIYAGDPEQLSMAHAFPRVYALEREHGSVSLGLVRSRRRAGAARRQAGEAIARGDTDAKGAAPVPPTRPRLISFRDGLQALPLALAAPLGKRLRLSTPVRSIHRADERWVVEAGDGELATARTVDAVVLAAPAHALAAMELPAPIRQHSAVIEHVVYPSVSSLTLGFRREQVAHPLDGFGVLLPEVEGRAVLGTLFSSTLFPGRAPEGHVALTVFVGGSRDPELARQPTDRIVEVVLRDLGDLLGVRGEPVFTQHVFWAKGIPQYTVGYAQVKDAADATEAANPGLYLTGNFRQGVSVGDCVASGQVVAERVAAWLAHRG
jgi:oxygen-dependent protoporphyrinogen oxidase